MPIDPLDRPARQDLLERLATAGCLDPAQARAAVLEMRAALPWRLWADRLLLALGTGLILAGVVFFFAYNWKAMGRFVKLGSVEAALLVCAVTAGRVRLEGLLAKVLLLSAAVLVGVFLVVQGQIYQTGADAWELFAAWALLVLAWTALGDFGVLWIGWLALVNTAITLYWQQVGTPAYGWSFPALCLALAAVNGIALALREIGVWRRICWLGAAWLRGILVMATLGALTLPPMAWVVNAWHYTWSPSFAVAAIGYPAALVIGCIWFRRRTPDLFVFTMVTLSGCVTGVSLVIRRLVDCQPGGGVALLASALLILGVATTAVWILQRIAAAMAREGLEVDA